MNMIQSILVALLTILLFALVELGKKAERHMDRCVRARKRILPPRDANGKFCNLFTISQMIRGIKNRR